ncbi:MAG: hypothetical protein AAGF47_05635 [Planctomycetota bacterium]
MTNRDTFKLAADDAIEAVARRRESFTIDDVRTVMRPGEGWPEIDLRALGGRMLAAQRRGLIEPTDRVVRSDRAACHHRSVRVWKSLTQPLLGAGTPA